MKQRTIYYSYDKNFRQAGSLGDQIVALREKLRTRAPNFTPNWVGLENDYITFKGVESD